MKTTRLDHYEQTIEQDMENYIPSPSDERKRMEQHIGKARDKKNVNLRLSAQDIESLKRQAAREGLPYQTLISSILHKYTTRQLLEEQHIRKSLQLFKDAEKSPT